MSSDWQNSFLGDLGTFKNGANYNQNDYGDCYPVVSVKNLFRGRFVTTDDLDALKEGVIKNIDDYLIKKDDLLFARSSVKREGSGQVAIVNDFPNNCIFSGFTIRFRANSKNVIDPLYLFYLFNSPRYREEFTRIATGTTIHNLSQANLARLEINLPNIAKQKHISSILGTLDKKIELNNQINQTLEAMAQSIFKSWFVDFEPVKAKLAVLQEGCSQAEAELAAMMAISGKTAEKLNTMRTTQAEAYQQLTQTAALFPSAMQESELGEIPDGWSVEGLDKIADVIDCLHSKKPNEEATVTNNIYLQLNNISDDGLLNLDKFFYISDADYKKWTSRIEVTYGDCIITNVGRVGAVSTIPEGVNAAIGRNITAIRLKPQFKLPAFLITLMTSQSMRREIENRTDIGTILNALNVKNIPKLRFGLPPISRTLS